MVRPSRRAAQHSVVYCCVANVSLSVLSKLRYNIYGQVGAFWCTVTSEKPFTGKEEASRHTRYLKRSATTKDYIYMSTCCTGDMVLSCGWGLGGSCRMEVAPL